MASYISQTTLAIVQPGSQADLIQTSSSAAGPVAARRTGRTYLQNGRQQPFEVVAQLRAD